MLKTKTLISWIGYILTVRSMVFIPRHHIRDSPNILIYYSDGDEDTPFGSDEGNDTLKYIFEAVRKDPNFDYSDFPRKLIEQDWDMEYIPVDTLDADEVGRMAADKEMYMIQSDMVTYATAFAQIKITGVISSELKERGIKAIKRLALIYGTPWNENEIQRKMVEDLQSFSFII